MALILSLSSSTEFYFNIDQKRGGTNDKILSLDVHFDIEERRGLRLKSVPTILSKAECTIQLRPSAARVISVVAIEPVLKIEA